MQNKTAACVIVLILQLSATVWANLPEPGSCGVDVSDRIYGGNITQINSYPWTAILVFRETGNKKDLFHCGGSLISDRYVLTAAHCVDDINEDYRLERIRLGEWDLQTENDCDSENICNDPPMDVGIAKITKHEDYNKLTLVNDIAIIELNQTITFSETVSPICLPLSEDMKTKATDDMTFVAIGWGNTEHRNGSYEYGSRYKLHVALKGVNMTYCDDVYDEDIISTQLCAGASEGEDTCQGDSGGGLVAAVDGYYYEYGVVSWGYGCGRKGVPGVYTRVTSFIPWITKQIT